MAEPIAKLYAKIGVDKSEFDRGMKDVKKGLDVSAVAMKAFGGVIAAYGVRAMADYTIGLAKVGTQHMRLEQSFRGLAKAPDALIASLKKASGATISENNLMLASNKAAMLGLGSDAEKLGQLMEIARFKGRAMGLETTQAYADMVTGLGRLSPMILDNLGITVDAEATFGAYAAKVGKSAEALSDMEKRQALLNRVLQEGKSQIAAAGGIADDAADSFERMNAKMEDMKTRLGELVAPSITTVVDVVVQGVDAVQAAIDGLKAQSPIILEVQLRQQLAQQGGMYAPGGMGGMGTPPKAPGRPFVPFGEMTDPMVMAAAEAEYADKQNAYLQQLEMFRNQPAFDPLKESSAAWAQSYKKARQDFQNRLMGERWAGLTPKAPVDRTAAILAENRTKEAEGVRRASQGMWGSDTALGLPAVRQLEQMARIQSQYETSLRRRAVATDKVAAAESKLRSSQYGVGGDRYMAGKMAGLKADDYAAVTDYYDKQTTEERRLAERRQSEAERYWANFESEAKRAWGAIEGFASGALGGLKPEEKDALLGRWGFGAVQPGAVSGVSGGLSAIGQGPDLGPLIEKAKQAVHEQYTTDQVREAIGRGLAMDPRAAREMKAMGIDVDAAIKDVGERQLDALKNMQKLTNVYVTNMKGGGGDGGGGVPPGPTETPFDPNTLGKLTGGLPWQTKADGGMVGWGLPRGTPVPTIMHAGEMVLNERQQRQGAGARVFNFHSGAIHVSGVQNPGAFFAELEALSTNKTG